MCCGIACSYWFRHIFFSPVFTKKIRLIKCLQKWDNRRLKMLFQLYVAVSLMILGFSIAYVARYLRKRSGG